MPTPASPSGPTPAGDDRNLVPVDENYVAPSFEDRLRLFWQRNSKAVTGVLIAVFIAIVAKGGWEALAAQNEQETQQAYAKASSSSELKAFVAAHPGHALTGAAQLRLADEAYADSKYADAATLYDQATPSLPAGPLASRARLGSAMAKMLSGKAAEGETALKAFVADTKEIKAFRAEAAYHLASDAISKGKLDDVKTYAEQLTQIDPMSPWTQRVMALRAQATAGTETAAPTSAPAITLPGTGK